LARFAAVKATWFLEPGKPRQAQQWRETKATCAKRKSLCSRALVSRQWRIGEEEAGDGRMENEEEEIFSGEGKADEEGA
jgi:hypothetical protein